MVKRIEENPLLSLFLIGAGLMFFNLEHLQISIMEARNFLVTREMFHDGNWLLTTLNGIPRYEKPPAPAWFSVPFAVLSDGESLFWMRFPNSVMALAGVFILYFWIKSETGNIRLSLFASLILATSFYYLAIRFEAPSDTHTHVWLLGGLFCLHLFLKSNDIRWELLLGASILAGLSILSKGPVGIYALFLPFIMAWFWVYKAPLLKSKIVILFVFLILALVFGGSWYLYVRVVDPEPFIVVAARETGNWTSYNVRPFYYYWSFFVQSGVWALPALAGLVFYPWIKNKAENPDLYKFSLIWTLLSVVLLSIIPEKKSRYLVPVLIPMAINTAIFMHTYIKMLKSKEVKNASLLSFVLIGISSLAALVFPLLVFVVEFKAVGSWIWYLSSSVLFMLTGGYLLYSIWKREMVKSFYLVVGIHVLITVFGLRAIDYLPRNENYRSVSEFQNPKKLPVYSFGLISPEVIWEVGSKLPVVNKELKNQNGAFLVFVDRDHEAEFLNQFSDCEFERYDSFDRNFLPSEGSRGYRQRHLIEVYLVKD